MAAALSKVLLSKGRLEIFRQLLGSSESRPGFFKIGVIEAVLRTVGTVVNNVCSDGAEGRKAFTNAVGMESREQVDTLAVVASSLTREASAGMKEQRRHWGRCGGDGWKSRRGRI